MYFQRNGALIYRYYGQQNFKNNSQLMLSIRTVHQETSNKIGIGKHLYFRNLHAPLYTSEAAKMDSGCSGVFLTDILLTLMPIDIFPWRDSIASGTKLSRWICNLPLKTRRIGNAQLARQTVALLDLLTLHEARIRTGSRTTQAANSPKTHRRAMSTRRIQNQPQGTSGRQRHATPPPSTRESFFTTLCPALH